MPLNSDSEAVSSSSSLLTSLRKFRFEKQKSSYNPTLASSSPSKTSERTPEKERLNIVSSVTVENLKDIAKTLNRSGSSLKISIPNKSVTITAVRSSLTSKKPSTQSGPLFDQQRVFTSSTLPKKALTGTVTSVFKSSLCNKDKVDCHSSNVEKINNTLKSGAPEAITKPFSEVEQAEAKKSHNSLNSTEATNAKDLSLSIETHRRAAMDDYDVFSEKEKSLRKLLRSFPNADIMEAQDLLVSCEWNVELAIETAQKKPLRTISRRRSMPFNFVGNTSDSGKGVVYEPETAGNESMLEFTEMKGSGTENINITEEIVLGDSSDSFEASKRCSSVGQENSVSSMGNSDSSKKRPLTEDESSGDMSSKKIKLTFNDGENAHCDNDKTDSCSEASSSQKLGSSSIDKPEQSVDANSEAKQSVTSDASTTKISTPLTEPTNNMVSLKANNSSSDTNLKKTQMQNKSNGSMKVPKKKSYESDDDDDDEDFGEQDVYNSDDSESGESLTPGRSAVLKFFQDSTVEELTTVPGCSKKKAEIILKYRPFDGWADLVCKLECEKSLSTDLLNGAKKVIDMRFVVSRIMTKCQKIAVSMEDLVESLKECKEEFKGYITEQPALLNNKMHLAPYQMLGLNWLLLMHTQAVNGILADEMGLGKTVQAISLLAYLKEQTVELPHLIVVPSSTLDNWKKELKMWWPTVSILCYHGSQDYRKELRLKILNGEIDEFDVVVTTYNMITTSTEDKNFFKRLDFYFVIFDEAHMLKNMSTQRYQSLIRVHAQRRLLLTGTPLQNNLVELMSLLIFVMPEMFLNKVDHVKQMFSLSHKSDEGKIKFEKERIEQAKRIMKPFVLRRLKSEVLQDLPSKIDEIKFCPMTEMQRKQYSNLVTILSEEVKNRNDMSSASGSGMMMDLRKGANHPLLLRHYFDNIKLKAMSELIIKEPNHKEANPDLVFEDMIIMSDFELHQLCKLYKSIASFQLSSEVILDSGKFAYLESVFPGHFSKGDRVLLFSQFTMMLDIVEEFMKIKKYKYLRLDGSVPVADRQILIDQFNEDSSIAVFLLSTKAGGLGINLTAANVVLLHDIDFNPYNDKQAEDRCHRVGQTRTVSVVRMISKDTIEEGMLARAKDKLKLEKDITSTNADTEEEDCRGVATLLKNALGLSNDER